MSGRLAEAIGLGGAAAAVDEEPATAVEDDAGWTAGNGDRQRLLAPVAGVQGARYFDQDLTHFREIGQRSQDRHGQRRMGRPDGDADRLGWTVAASPELA